MTGIAPYIYYNDYKSWYDALSYCRLHHTDLASAKDEIQYAALLTKIPLLPLEYVWIGLTRDSWMWIDQTKPDNLAWISGQPDNYYGNEMCGFIINYLAGDAQCTDVNSIFCYGG